MGDPVTFKTIATGIDMFQFRVAESESGIRVGDFNDRESAENVRDFANAEHANGRVAQSRCVLGHACDRDRIHVPTMLRPSVEVILCATHENEIDMIRGLSL